MEDGLDNHFEYFNIQSPCWSFVPTSRWFITESPHYLLQFLKRTPVLTVNMVFILLALCMKHGCPQPPQFGDLVLSERDQLSF